MSGTQGDTNNAVRASASHGEDAIRAVHGVIAALESQLAALMAAAEGSENPSDFEDAARAISAAIEHYRDGIPMISRGMDLSSSAAARR